ncbi:MAG: alkyl sulfatase dimerization domain-containing protein [Haloarculaceae archaeon]
MPEADIDPFETDMFVDPRDSVVEVTDRTYFHASFSAITAFETDAGLVLVDTGVEQTSARMAETLRETTDAPVHTAIYTHGHLDHAYGLEQYLTEGQDDPRVIAHENVPDRFARYARTAGHNEAINARQFGGAASETDDLTDESGSRFREPNYPPTTLYDDAFTIEVGETTFQLRHAKGETDDHTYVYCPDREVLCSGDFHINVAPNAGNPQKVQRYPWEWADTLREMAGLEPEHLCPGHGRPVVGDPEEVQERLLGSAAYLDEIVDQTLAALNDGSPPHVDIVHELDLPDYDEPWLAESYDEAAFIARNVVRYYGGWWSGRPSELKPAPREELAGEVAALAGDARTLADRALALADDDIRVACHLADYALEAAPDDDAVQEAVVEVYERRALAEENLMSGNIYSSAAEYAREGRPFR